MTRGLLVLLLLALLGFVLGITLLVAVALASRSLAEPLMRLLRQMYGKE